MTGETVEQLREIAQQARRKEKQSLAKLIRISEALKRTDDDSDDDFDEEALEQIVSGLKAIINRYASTSRTLIAQNHLLHRRIEDIEHSLNISWPE